MPAGMPAVKSGKWSLITSDANGWATVGRKIGKYWSLKRTDDDEN
jgi:hypothetical protein